MADIILVTGLPGHGKTLNTLKYVEENYQDFSVYYTHIEGLNIERWQLLDDPLKWADCPPKSVVVIDEAHNYFPGRSAASKMPDVVNSMSEHRHKGITLIFITQDPKKLDHDIRNLCSKHLHFFRPLGLTITKRFEWARAQEKPFSKQAQDGALTSKSFKLDKKYFNLYKSAEVHTVKRKIPPKLLMLPACLGVVGLCVYFFYSQISARYGLSSDDVIAEVQAAEIPELEQLPRVSSVSMPSMSSTKKEMISSEWHISGVVQWAENKGTLILEREEGEYRRLSLFEYCRYKAMGYSCDETGDRCGYQKREYDCDYHGQKLVYRF